MEVADRIIREADLKSGGAFTAVGTYPHSELLALVSKLAEVSGIESGRLIRAFGRHLLRRFTELYPSFFEEIDNTFAFLETINNHVHVEVLKLYPDAELPRFECERLTEGTLVMNYSSRRPLADLAHGLIEGAGEHWQENIHIAREDSQNHDGERLLNKARFTLTAAP